MTADVTAIATEPPRPSCPHTLLVFVGDQQDAEGYPPLALLNCVDCKTTVARAQPGRCDVCNELEHAGPCAPMAEASR